jgi:hypothetical protein
MPSNVIGWCLLFLIWREFHCFQFSQQSLLWDDTQEAKWFVARVDELVGLIGRDVHYVPIGDITLLFTVANPAPPANNKDAVVMDVLIERAPSARLYLDIA